MTKNNNAIFILSGTSLRAQWPDIKQEKKGHTHTRTHTHKHTHTHTHTLDFLWSRENTCFR